jgi:hypothetical protein
MVRALVLVALVLVLAGPAHAGRPFLIAATDPLLAQANPVASQREAERLSAAGLNGVRLMVGWTLGVSTPSSAELARLQNAAAAAKAKRLTLVLDLFPAGSAQTPLTDAARSDFAQWAAAIARSVPSVTNVVIGNEPNLNRFWLPQFGPSGEDTAAPQFVSLLAQAYDALKAVSPAIRVWGGGLARAGSDKPGTTRDTHSPVSFITDMGIAYRASGRTAPIMDGLAYHPYMESSNVPPSRGHSDVSTTITIADYARLVALLGAAFDGTAQGGSTLPILYDEFGVESIPTPDEQQYYSGSEAASVHPVDPQTQSAYYASALRLAYCSPNVVGLAVFLFEDEHPLSAWQSGLYYANAAPKPSLKTVQWASRRVRGRGFDC